MRILQEWLRGRTAFDNVTVMGTVVVFALVLVAAFFA